MRNPKWHRDEIILALDLYFNEKLGSIDKGNPNIIELSEIINKLPLFPEKPDAEKFRNPNGVALKLSNFKAIDPSYTGKGMQSHSKLDAEIFNEFNRDRDRLKHIANEIKKVAFDPSIKTTIYGVEEDEISIKDSVMEGQVLYKLHKVRERDVEIVHTKKQQMLSSVGRLDCEVCIFNFELKYGELGKGFIECHHRIPLSNFKVEKKTTLADLALVCSNCHRMLHRSLSYITIDDLRTKLNS